MEKSLLTNVHKVEQALRRFLTTLRSGDDFGSVAGSKAMKKMQYANTIDRPPNGYVSQGSDFQYRPPQQGSRYVWTRKVQAKTFTVALSQN